MVDIFQVRRQALANKLNDRFGTDKWLLLVLNNFEDGRLSFRSESSFFYLTGVNEPASVLVMGPSGGVTFYYPARQEHHSKWQRSLFDVALASGQAEKKLGVTDVRVLGEVVPRKTPSLDFDKRIYSNLTSDLAEFSKSGLLLCSLLEHGSSRYAVQRIIAAEVLKSAGVDKELTDISAELHAMRRNKGKEEIVATFDAAMSTMAAHGMVAKMIRNGIFEYEVRAIIESAFISLGSSGPAFPTIVASGGNGAILHYTELSSKLMDGDLVVVDIGAENLMYAADISRTYPVSGMFTPRQRELYQLVLDAQAYAESVVRPGMYLSNVDDQDLSVHHKVLKFLEPHGLDKAFYHGIGHFLGLDVHDVGDYKVPLKSGDMFTLEPGVYLPDERLGIRIEDDYVLADDGIMCLTADLPKSPDEIEAMMNEGAE